MIKQGNEVDGAEQALDGPGADGRVMSRRRFGEMVGVAIATSVAGGVLGRSAFADQKTAYAEREKIVLSWLTAVGMQGQVVEVMKRTDVLDRWGLAGEYKAFNIAGPVVSAAAAGAVDVYWAADLGVWGLNGRGFDWTVVGANNGWRFGIVVRADSKIEKLADLKGKTFGYPFSTGTGKYLEDVLSDNGIVPGKDVTIKNIGAGDVGAALISGGVDAVGSWDPPMITQLAGQKIIYSAATGAGTGRPGTVFAVPTEMLKKNPAKIKNFLGAYLDAMWFSINNLDMVNNWFVENSQFTPEILMKCVENDPMYQVKDPKEFNMTVDEEMLAVMRNNVKYFLDKGVLEKSVDPEKYVNNDIVKEAQDLFVERGPGQLKVKKA